MKNKCKKDCPKGGICDREIIGTPEGRLYVKDHFKCEWVQKFIMDMANRKIGQGG